MTGPSTDVGRPVRTRFAPSPTGRLHLGNVRIAAFNQLFARHHAGAFVLRIEDTDVERTVEGSEAALLEDLRWLGLDWDEGPGVGGAHRPYRQSERADLHLREARRLVEAGRAYPCYCSDEELAADVEATPSGPVHRYPGRCRDLTAEERRSREAEGRVPALRFARPGGVDAVEIQDEVRGSISFPIDDFDDFVIVRRDGRPTYNFAVVVDDVAMEITHVIRGAGHLSNTPRQALLFDALAGRRPVFAHLPTVLAPGGGKLSKRTGSAAVAALREAGYHPDGVVNYLSLLGWSSPDGREVLARDELVERIGLDRVGASDTIYDPEKLRWMSGQHIQAMDGAELAEAIRPFVAAAGRESDFPGPRLRALGEALRSRLTTWGDVPEHLATFLPPSDAADLAEARRAVRADPDARTVLDAVARDLHRVRPHEWEADELGRRVRAAGKSVEARGPALFHPLRRVLTGRDSGPDLGAVMEALGRPEVLERLDASRS